MYEGQLFGSFCEFVTFLRAYENKNYVCFAKTNCKTIQAIQYKPRHPIMPELKYCIIQYTCVRGGPRVCRGTGKRKKSTIKIDCPAHICLHPTLDGKNLKISKLNLTHNHEISEEAFRKLPQQRRLPPDVKKRAKEMLDMDVNKKRLLQKLRTETGKNVTLRDLYNLAKQDRLNCTVEETTLQEEISDGHKNSAETNANGPVPVSVCHNYDADTNSNEPVPAATENDDKMVFIQNRANKAVEELVREKKRSNDLKEKLLGESRKRNTYLDALVKSNDVKVKLLEESRKRNKYLGGLLKLECILYNQSVEEQKQE